MIPPDVPTMDKRLPPDHAFRALSHPIRRRVLAMLVNDDPREPDAVASTELDADELQRATIALHHSHLPHLEGSGLVDWDRGSGSIARGERFEDIRPLLELMEDHREELPHGWP